DCQDDAEQRQLQWQRQRPLVGRGKLGDGGKQEWNRDRAKEPSRPGKHGRRFPILGDADVLRPRDRVLRYQSASLLVTISLGISNLTLPDSPIREADSSSRRNLVFKAIFSKTNMSSTASPFLMVRKGAPLRTGEPLFQSGAPT